jgi:hypothetical protein
LTKAWQFSNRKWIWIKKTLKIKGFQSTLNSSNKSVVNIFIPTFITLSTNLCFTCFAHSFSLGNLALANLKFNLLGSSKQRKRRKTILIVKKYVFYISNCSKIGCIIRSKTTTTFLYSTLSLSKFFNLSSQILKILLISESIRISI